MKTILLPDGTPCPAWLQSIMDDTFDLASKIRADAINMAQSLSDSPIPMTPGHFDLMDEQQYQAIRECLVIIGAWQLFTEWVEERKNGQKTSLPMMQEVCGFLMDIVLGYNEEKGNRA
jgi:hypothetical protein